MQLDDQQKQFWHDNGYLLLKSHYNAERIDQINDLIQRLWRHRKKLDQNYVIDIFVGTDKERRVYFADAPKDARSAPYKLNDLYLTQEAIRDITAGERLDEILQELLQGTPMICNSLNFEFGSQQESHFDTFYMPSPTPNKMVASWIALEDATQDNGPLAYYPGSHKIPPYHFSNGSTIVVENEMDAFNDYIYQEIEKRGLQQQHLHAEKGDVLIWHSQLFHGGSEIVDKSKTRKSLVTHYFTLQDFPDEAAPSITDNSCYMARAAQPVPYPFKTKNWFERVFG